jgi:hypothetical protein
MSSSLPPADGFCGIATRADTRWVHQIADLPHSFALHDHPDLVSAFSETLDGLDANINVRLIDPPGLLSRTLGSSNTS